MIRSARSGVGRGRKSRSERSDERWASRGVALDWKGCIVSENKVKQNLSETHVGEEKKKGVDEDASVVSSEAKTSRAAETICRH